MSNIHLINIGDTDVTVNPRDSAASIAHLMPLTLYPQIRSKAVPVPPSKPHKKVLLSAANVGKSRPISETLGAPALPRTPYEKTRLASTDFGTSRLSAKHFDGVTAPSAKLPVQEQPELPLEVLIEELENALKHSSQGVWQKGATTHDTVTQTGYKIGSFHHADDAAFVDVMHNQAVRIITELKALKALRDQIALKATEPAQEPVEQPNQPE
jgi:hypothetical protein